MVRLINKANTEGVTTAYPYGSVKDNPGDNTGTPVNRAVYSDMHQFFEKLFAESGITANNLPDNATNGFQLFDAFLASTGPDQTPAYSGTYYDNGTYPIRFRKIPGRQVQVRGRTAASVGDIAANEVIFTLPVGYRPTYFKYFQCWCSANNTFCLVRVDTTGTVTVIYNASVAVNREHIHTNFTFPLD